MTGEQTTRRFRVCNGCGELFHTVRSAKLHQATCDGNSIESITAVVRE